MLALVFQLLLSANSAPMSDAQLQAVMHRANLRYDANDYAAALQGYMAAYVAKPMPVLLLRMGRCHKALGQHEAALNYFQGYLREERDPQVRAGIELLVREEEEAVRKERQHVLAT